MTRRRLTARRVRVMHHTHSETRRATIFFFRLSRVFLQMAAPCHSVDPDSVASSLINHSPIFQMIPRCWKPVSDIITAVANRHDAVTAISKDANVWYRALRPEERKRFVGKLPSDPAQFTAFVRDALCLFVGSRQDNFKTAMRAKEHAHYREKILDIPLLILATCPPDLPLVRRRNNNMRYGLECATRGSDVASSFYYRLRGDVKLFAQIVSSLEPDFYTEGGNKVPSQPWGFMCTQCSSCNFRDHMESARKDLTDRINLACGHGFCQSILLPFRDSLPSPGEMNTCPPFPQLCSGQSYAQAHPGCVLHPRAFPVVPLSTSAFASTRNSFERAEPLLGEAAGWYRLLAIAHVHRPVLCP
jgi:hypothetical protein